MNLLEVKNISKTYGNGETAVKALKDVSFSVPKGEYVAIVGESGSGKSTLLNMIGALDTPTSGKVLIDGKDIFAMNDRKLTVFRRRNIGFIFQAFNLIPELTVEQNMIFPLLLDYQKPDKRYLEELLTVLNLKDRRNHLPSQLSGGQQQRIGVLRALAASPPIVLMDEPFGALDPQTREALQDEVKNLQQRLGKTIIFVTHDMDEALKLADIIIFMDGGEVVQMASPEEMLENPATERVRNFLGKHASGTQPPSKVEQFMRTNVQSVQRDRGVLECAERMARHSVDTLLVTDEQNRYLGTISIGDIRHWGRELTSIEPLIRQTARTVRVGDEAKESFDYLLDSGANYVVVLNADDTIAGIVTKTSVARSVAENLWGDSK